MLRLVITKSDTGPYQSSIWNYPADGQPAELQYYDDDSGTYIRPLFWWDTTGKVYVSETQPENTVRINLEWTSNY